MPGGELLLHGVRVVESDPDVPPLSLEKQYLVFLAFDSTGSGATIPCGGSGIYRVGADGTLARYGIRDDLVSKDVRQTFHGKLAELRSRVMGGRQ
jgi:hypothetical protein